MGKIAHCERAIFPFGTTLSTVSDINFRPWHPAPSSDNAFLDFQVKTWEQMMKTKTTSGSFLKKSTEVSHPSGAVIDWGQVALSVLRSHFGFPNDFIVFIGRNAKHWGGHFQAPHAMGSKEWWSAAPAGMFFNKKSKRWPQLLNYLRLQLPNGPKTSPHPEVTSQTNSKVKVISASQQTC